MRKLTLIAFILLAMVLVVSAETLSVPSTIYSQGEVSKPSSFAVNLTVNPTVEHVPIDVVLAIDCSPSMGRYSKVIYGPVTVNITKYCCRMWQSIANFTLSSTSNVQVILSYPLEDYYNETGWGYDRIDHSLDNTMGGMMGGMTGGMMGMMGYNWYGECSDPASYIFYNVQPGTHTIYARLYGMPRTEIRELVVALPPTKINATKDVAKYFVGLLKDYDRAAVVRFGSNKTTYIAINLTDDKNQINSTIDGNLTLDDWQCIDVNGMMCCCGGCGRIMRAYELTSLTAGLEKAYYELKTNGRPYSQKVIILLSDGDNNNGGYNYSSPIDVAKLCAENGIRIYTIGFGVVNETLLKKIAEITGGKYYYAPSCEDLEEIYNEIYKEIEVYATNVTLTLNFNNPNIKFDQATPAPTSVVGNTVSWQWNELKNNTSITVWVNSTIAREQTVASGNLTYYDYYGWHSKNFTVIMNFTGNLIVKAVPDKNTVWEGETVNITITANYPIANLTYSANPSISKYNSNISLNISGNSAVLNWTPFYNYVDNDTNATLMLTITSIYGISNSTDVGITVRNVQAPPVMIVANPDKTSITENEPINITVTANYPIDKVIYNATPPITTNNSIVNVNVGGNNATVTWTPLPNYISKDTLANVSITVICPPYGSNNTTLNIAVKNLPLIVSATVNKTTIVEGEPLGIEVSTNLPFGNVNNITLTGNPAITLTNSIVRITKINNTSARIVWTPLNSYIDKNTTVNLTISVTDIYGDTNSTSKQIEVINNVKPTPILLAPRTVNVTEGELKIIEVTAKNFTQYKQYKVIIGGIIPSPNLNASYNNPIAHILETIPTLNDSNLVIVNSTTWIKPIAPQYDFIEDKNVTSDWFKIIWWAINSSNGAVIAQSVTNVTVMNNATVNLTVDPIPKVIKAPPDKIYYVGELIPIEVAFKNATSGWVEANNVRIWKNASLTNYPVTVYLIPNTPGIYVLKVFAENNTLNKIVSEPITEVRVYIKPVTPS